MRKRGLDMLYFIAILWVILPFGLIPWCIITTKNYKNEKKHRMHLQNELIRMQHFYETRQQAKKNTVSEPMMQEERVVPELMQQEERVVSNQRSAPVRSKSDMGEFGRIQMVMILGVGLVLLAGLVFATSAWNIMPNIMKMVLLVSMSAIFFATAFIAKQKYDLRITSIAFYQLGCVFLPIAMLCIGFFGLLGDYLTLTGEGTYWLQFIIGSSFFILSHVGHKIYDTIVFYYAAWGAQYFSILMITKASTGDFRISFIVLGIYILFIMTKDLLKRENVQRHAAIKYLHPIIGFITTTIIITVPKTNNLDDFITKFAIGYIIYAFAIIYLYKMFEKVSGIRLHTWISVIMSVATAYMAAILFLVTNEWSALASFLVILVSGLYEIMKIKEEKRRVLFAWFLTLVLFSASALLIDMVTFSLNVIVLGVSYIFLLFLGLIFIQQNENAWRKLFELPILISTSLIILYSNIGNIYYRWSVLPLCLLYIMIFIFKRKEKIFARIIMIASIVIPMWAFGVLIDTRYQSDSYAHVYTLIAAIIGCSYIKWSRLKDLKDGAFIRNTGYVSLYIGYLGGMYIYFIDSFNFELFLSLTAIIIGANVLVLQNCGRMLLSLANILAIPFILKYVSMYLEYDSIYYVGCGIGLSILSWSVGKIYSKKLILINDKKNVEDVNVFAFSSILGMFPIFAVGDERFVFAGIITLAVWTLGFYKWQNEVVDRIAIYGAMILTYIAWCNQPFVDLPDLIQTEYYIVGAVILLFIWSALPYKVVGKDKIQYGIVIAMVVVQLMSCLISNEIVDLLIIGISMLGIFALAQIKKQLRWLWLSLVVIAILLLYTTKSIWMNIAWWIYILIAGIVLIVVAVKTEKKKKEKQKRRQMNLGNEEQTDKFLKLDGWEW